MLISVRKLKVVRKMPISYDRFDEPDFFLSDVRPRVTMFYKDIDEQFKFDNLDFTYVQNNCPLLNSRLDILKQMFPIHFNDYEIGSESEYGFFLQLQDALVTNADTMERQLEVYDDDIAKPILGRTEKVTYDVTNKRDETGNNNESFVELPVDNPDYDKDSTRTKANVTTERNDAQTGTVTTELSDLGVRPNYDSLNGFLDNNRTFVKFFYMCFEGCFSPRYRRIELYY